MTLDFQPVAPRMPDPPRRLPPAGACDTHTHVFGPFERHPVPAPSSYAPPIAPPAVHQDMLDRAGLGRAILIQPAPYGTNNAALVEALHDRPETTRGVAVLSAEASDDMLAELAGAGVKGLRFNEMRDPRSGGRYKGSVALAEYIQLAPRMKEHGLIPHVWAKCALLAEALPTVLAAGQPLVIDHMASIEVEAGVDDPAFRTILRLLVEERIWVKLSLCRNSASAPDYPDQRPFHDALIAANPDRLLWGSDWPFVRMYANSPDVGHLLDILDDWVGDEAILAKVLVTNPARLYGFAPA